MNIQDRSATAEYTPNNRKITKRIARERKRARDEICRDKMKNDPIINER